MTRRLPSLTSLRWFAAFVVFAGHALAAFFQGTGTGASLIGITDLGEPAVAFFFVLSGFVLTWSRSDGDSARAFYRRRFARIAPTYWVVTLAAIAISYAAVRVTITTGRVETDGFSLTFLQAWFPGTVHGGNAVNWSISVEAFFYATFPLLVGPVVRLAPAARATLAAAMCLVASASPFVLPSHQWAWRMLPLARLPEFVLGICLASLLSEGRRLRVAPLAAGCVAGAGLVAAASQGVGLHAARALTLAPLALLIYAAAQADVTGVSMGPLRSPLAIRLGQWSFAFYLVHFPVLRLLVVTAQHFGLKVEGGWAPTLGSHPQLAGRIVLVVAALGISTAVAAITHIAIEHPLERRLRGAPGTATPPQELPAASA